MQDVSGVYTSPFLHRDKRKMALRARKASGASEKRTPGRCSTQRPDAIHFFVNFDVFESLYLSQN